MFISQRNFGLYLIKKVILPHPYICIRWFFRQTISWATTFVYYRFAISFYIRSHYLHFSSYLGNTTNSHRKLQIPAQCHCDISLSLRIFLSIALHVLTAQNITHNQRAHINKMVAFSKRLGLRETNHRFFLGNEYWDLMIFSFSLNAAITFFLYSKYRPISVAE